MSEPHAHSHNHGRSHHNHSHSHAPRALKLALLITVVIMIVEVIGGFLAGSLALLSDAAHLLTDIGALFLSLFAIWIGKKPRTLEMTFGYRRAEILGALISALAIWLLAGMVIYEAIHRLNNPHIVSGPIVFYVALVGLIANLISMRVLHGSHQQLNVKAAYLHLVADSLSSVGAVIAGVILWWTGWQPIDPIISIGFSILMLWGSFGLIRETIGILMLATPKGINPKAVTEDLLKISGVTSLHDLHIWSLTPEEASLSVHLMGEFTPKSLGEAKKVLKDRYAITHSTIQLESSQATDPSSCQGCDPCDPVEQSLKP